ncbi:MAG: hypothetical protein Q9191_002875 [Dirinaria sp. TL-2023a]
MPPKKAVAAASQKKATAAPAHASYRDMIKEAILTLKERNGSRYGVLFSIHYGVWILFTFLVASFFNSSTETSRPSSRSAIKKYILANHKPAASSAAFDTQFNRALRTGVEKGEFAQPKGPSGTTKLAKKEAAAKPATEKKAPAAKKEKSATGKTTATKKKTAAPKKATKVAGPKKAGAPKKTAAPKAKANTASKRKTPAKADAIVTEEKVLGKTKSGRVTKTPAKAASKPKKAAPKKAASATPKKTATPKKKAEPTPAS